MTRLPRRLARELAEVADQARPSPATWWSIRSRVASETAQADADVIVLEPKDVPVSAKQPILALAAVTAGAAFLVFLKRVQRFGAMVRRRG